MNFEDFVRKCELLAVKGHSRVSCHIEEGVYVARFADDIGTVLKLTKGGKRALVTWHDGAHQSMVTM